MVTEVRVVYLGSYVVSKLGMEDMKTSITVKVTSDLHIITIL